MQVSSILAGHRRYRFLSPIGLVPESESMSFGIIIPELPRTSVYRSNESRVGPCQYVLRMFTHHSRVLSDRAPTDRWRGYFAATSFEDQSTFCRYSRCQVESSHTCAEAVAAFIYGRKVDKSNMYGTDGVADYAATAARRLPCLKDHI